VDFIPRRSAPLGLSAFVAMSQLFKTKLISKVKKCCCVNIGDVFKAKYENKLADSPQKANNNPIGKKRIIKGDKK